MVTATYPAQIPMESVDVVIVGGGPAGLSTAMHLVQRDPSFKDRLVILERARHPREKLCAGGVSGHALAILKALGCELDIPAIDVTRAVLRCGSAELAIDGAPALTVTHRPDFDAWLYRCAIERGIRVDQDQSVQDILVDGDRVQVTTRDRRFTCRVLVGADGTTSLVRRRAGLEGNGGTARLLEVRTPEDPAAVAEFRDRTAAFDFTSLGDGLEGYYWDFPSIVDGEHQMNRGVFESRIARSAQRADLTGALRAKLVERSRDLDAVRMRGFGIHHFSMANRISRANVLLVGDAAGADPLLGEGIRCGLGYGSVAAHAIAASFTSGDLSFRSYRRRLLVSPTGRMMLARRLIASLVYRSWSPGAITRIARALSRLQNPAAPSLVASDA